jgi:RNA polymerase sigma-54 factor
LQQAIRLLQLSTLELQTEIQEALEANLMLERLEEDANGDNSQANGGDADSDSQESRIEREAEVQAKSDNNDSEADSADTQSMDLDTRSEIPEDLPVDSGWDDIYEPSLGIGSRNDEPMRDFTEYTSDGEGSLQDHLLEQMHLQPLGADDRLIATALIEAIDENGYLSESLDDLLDGLNEQRGNGLDLLELDELEAVLRLIQQFDPAGCGARDLAECMSLQLNGRGDSAVIRHALLLVNEHLELLAAHDYTRLRRLTRMNDSELADAISLIRSLNPRPGSQVAGSHAQYVVPDVFVRKIKGVWRVELNPDIAPKLGINSLYSSMVRRADKSADNNFLRNHLQEARWFIKSLQSRNETLLRVATAIVERQRAFLEYGDEGMKPMVLRDIAEQLEMHESTISRVTTQKYMHTPRGIFEFKYFFSSHVSTADGGECSATAIRAMIRKLIADENQQKPLSDSKIASTLVENGIKVARRTVAKYREAMAIPPSNERKRLL